VARGEKEGAPGLADGKMISLTSGIFIEEINTEQQSKELPGEEPRGRRETDVNPGLVGGRRKTAH